MAKKAGRNEIFFKNLKRSDIENYLLYYYKYDKDNGFDVLERQIVVQYFSTNFPQATPKRVTEHEKILKDIGVHEHVRDVCKHRKYLQQHFQTLKSVSSSYMTDKIESRIKLHDLSKYSADEVIGYALKFQHQFDEKEHSEYWDKALSHHYEYNQHHPENKHLVKQDMPFDALVESVLDMMACISRTTGLESRKKNLSKLLDINVIYLKRYTEKDRAIVEEIIKNLKEAAAMGKR